MKRVLFLIALTIGVSSLFAQTTIDLGSSFAASKDNLAPITTLTISNSENIRLFPTVKNNGTAAASGEVKFEIQVKSTLVPANTSGNNGGKLNLTETPLAPGDTRLLCASQGVILTSSQIKTWSEGDLEFEISVKITYDGDTNAENDTYKLKIKVETKSDIEVGLARAYTPSKIVAINQTSTIQVPNNENLILFPYIKNLGPDVADKNVISKILINDTEITEFTTDSPTNLLLNHMKFISEDQEKFTITVERIRQVIGDSKDDFSITFETAYQGIDPVAKNNKKKYKAKIITPRSDVQLVLCESFLSNKEIPGKFSIKETENLTLYPKIKNNGPHKTNDSIYMHVTLKNSDTFYETLGYDIKDMLNGESFIASSIPGSETPKPFEFKAEELEKLLRYEKTFTVVFNINYKGNDADIGNNETKIVVTREEVLLNGKIDLAPYFVDKIIGTHFYYPVSEHKDIKDNVSLRVLPAIKNHGTVGAYGSANAKITIDYKEDANIDDASVTTIKTDFIDEKTIDLNNLKNDLQYVLLSDDEGITIDLDDLEKYGHKKFDVCIEIDYTGGTDGNSANDKFCFTVKREKTTSINSIEGNTNISIYPNPAKNIININNADGKEIKILNALGNVIIKDKDVDSIDISELSNGTYFIKIDEVTQKFVILK